MPRNEAQGVYRRRYKNKAGETVVSRFWSITWLDEHKRRRRRTTKYTKRQLAEVERGEEVERVERRRAGLPDLGAEVARARAVPLDLVGLYLEDAKRRGLSPGTLDVYRRRLTALLAGVDSLEKVTPGWVGRALTRVATRELTPTEVKFRRRTTTSAKTLNYYRGALSTFFAWLVERGHWPTNPVSKVARSKVVGLADTERRPLSPEELERLVDAVPMHRGACYLLAATAGLRRGELHALREDEVSLEGGWWVARAAWTKNRKASRLPLPRWTCEVLARYLEDFPPTRTPKHGGKRPRGERLFAAIPQNSTLRSDLKRAGIEPENAEGKVDLHALARYTYARWLAVNRVPLATAQELMRHSDPKLTANIYTRFFLGDLAAEVAKLTRPSGDT